MSSRIPSFFDQILLFQIDQELTAKSPGNPEAIKVKILRYLYEILFLETSSQDTMRRIVSGFRICSDLSSNFKNEDFNMN